MRGNSIFWSWITELGTKGILDGRTRRDIQITNKISSYLTFASLAFLLAQELINPGLNYVFYVLPLTFIGITVLLLNATKHPDASRVVLCLSFPYYLLAVTVYSKLQIDLELSSLRYFTPRIAMLAGGLFPVLLFGTKGNRPWILMVAGTFLCLLIYNPVHNMLGVGYYQKGFTDAGYYGADVFFVIVYAMIVMSAFSLKKHMEHSETEREMANEVLNKQNSDLTDANNQIKSQNHEIMTQNEEILAQNEHITAQEKTLRGTFERLTRANEMIETQRHALEDHNDRLAKLLSDSDRNLLEANEELMKHNNELHQFSYTVSHHLRGPVARLLGLTNLFRMNHDAGEIIDHVRKSAHELDQTLHDLTRIIDIRNEVYSVRERVVFEEQFETAKRVLKEQFPEVNMVLADFSEAPAIISIAPVVFSVIHQLMSNALIFKSPDRMLKVNLRTYREYDEIVLEIADNGIGMDVELYKNDIFKMYRTFHAHRAGRGLGLYMVKTQLGIISARIDVKSIVNQGTIFTIGFKSTENSGSQLCFQNDYATIKYFALFEAFELAFIARPSSEEFRKVLLSAVELIKQYKTTAFISDLRISGQIADTDQEWILRTILNAAIDVGIKRIFHIVNPGQETLSSDVHDMILSRGISVSYVSSMEEVLQSLEVFAPAR